MKTIYYGTILTMEDNQPQAEAICIENGIIQAVGKKEEVMKWKDEETHCIDLQDHVLLPSFIDPHSHFVGVANSLSQCDLSEARSFQDIIEKMRDFIERRKIQPGEWVHGTAYDHNFLRELHHPDRHILDEISTKHPIVLGHVSSHMGVVNTLGLEMMKLEAQTKDPDGGKYGRDVNGSLNGYMEENAYIALVNALPMASPDKLMELMKEAQQIYASYGITTVQDGFIARPLFQLIEYAAQSKIFYLDIIGYIDLNHCHALTKEKSCYVKHYRNHFKIGGYKIFLDGSPQGRTAWMTTAYQGDEPDYYGYPVLTDERLYELIAMALEDDMQLLAHCNGDAAAQQYLDQFKKVQKEYPKADTNRPVMIHAQLVREDQLNQMIPLQMIPSFFVAHTYFWGDIHIQNFGKKRADLISPARSAVKLGLPFTFHQDSPVIQPDMMRTIWCAVNRRTRTGVSIGKEQCITTYEALKAVTIHAAYQYFEEDRKGSLKPGKLADLVILDHNPLTADPKDLADILVLETIKEGTTVYRRK